MNFIRNLIKANFFPLGLGQIKLANMENQKLVKMNFITMPAVLWL
ncbi:hypothetical protein LX77_03443 [Gelidibacter algens]|jgi:hypothetical protein|uniref:Uncharacterized protein n=1 Tax=Gelidibacter algens TaxID=49280 RepID=A0A327RRR1_9FLAO|nr:hypothetical protein LX77_03443 [Gelidibacter algens]